MEVEVAVPFRAGGGGKGLPLKKKNNFLGPFLFVKKKLSLLGYAKKITKGEQNH